MAVYNNVVVTDAGITLLRDIVLSGRALNAADVATSETVISNPQTATAVPDVVQVQAYSLYSRDANQFVLEAQLTNTGITTAYSLNTVGFYVNDGVTGDVLLAVITAQAPDTIPPESAYPVNVNFRAIIAVDNSGDIQINASFAGYATMESLGGHMGADAGGASGVHGLRFAANRLQVWDGAAWRVLGPGGTPAPPVDPVLANNDWGTISDVSRGYIARHGLTAGDVGDLLGWHVGDEITFTLPGNPAQDITLQVYGFNHDTLVGGGRAGITFGMKGLMSGGRRMNATATNSGGFPKSELYAWLGGAVYGSLPPGVKGAIRTAVKPTGPGGGASFVDAVPMDLFLFSASECFGDAVYPGIPGLGTAPEGAQYPIFTDDGSRVKYMDGGPAIWWTRSADEIGNPGFYCVHYYGAGDSEYANEVSIGVCFGFCV
jgi:hypothetical protein